MAIYSNRKFLWLDHSKFSPMCNWISNRIWDRWEWYTKTLYCVFSIRTETLFIKRLFVMFRGIWFHQYQNWGEMLASLFAWSCYNCVHLLVACFELIKIDQCTKRYIPMQSIETTIWNDNRKRDNINIPTYIAISLCLSCFNKTCLSN